MASLACFGVGEDVSKVMAEELHAVGPTHDTLNQNVGGDTIEAERRDFTTGGKERIGFASSEVPTAEEKTVTENRPPTPQADFVLEHHQPDTMSEGSETPDDEKAANSTRVLDKADPPANTLPNEHQPLPPRPDGEGQEGSSTHKTIRKQRTGKLGIKWAVPVPRPHVDPDGFEDPISDAFWKNVWVASAAYNVCYLPYSGS